MCFGGPLYDKRKKKREKYRENGGQSDFTHSCPSVERSIKCFFSVYCQKRENAVLLSVLSVRLSLAEEQEDGTSYEDRDDQRTDDTADDLASRRLGDQLLFV